VIRALLLAILVIIVLRVVRALLAQAGSARAPEAVRWDPHAVLGVTPGASREEITQAYRHQLKRYHPDRVADLGPELQHVAHQKTVELQRAYAELTR
jgi:DnaJ-domain-containing protein 1